MVVNIGDSLYFDAGESRWRIRGLIGWPKELERDMVPSQCSKHIRSNSIAVFGDDRDQLEAVASLGLGDDNLRGRQGKGPVEFEAVNDSGLELDGRGKFGNRRIGENGTVTVETIKLMGCWRQWSV